MTLTQLIQGAPAKANELFAKLADTSDGAVKTRERLLAELKEELETQAQLEERHLFPVLRKHKETRDLVQEAINDNREAKALLAELETIPKDGEDFARKLAELRKVFQQHVRDERKELLPAVRKALSDEEAQAVSDKIEAGRARIEDARREEAEQRRAEARREREAVEAMARPAERIIRAEAGVVETGAQVARSGLDATQRGVRQAAEAASRTARQVAPPVLEQFQALAQAPAAVARAAGEAGGAWMEYVNRTTRAGAEAFQQMSRCSGPAQLAEAQQRFVWEAARAWMDVGSRMLDLTVRASGEALRPGDRR